MPHFLVIAQDGTDPEAPARRQAARPAHFARLQNNPNALTIGGAILNEADAMAGSYFIMEAASRADVERFIAEDPYTREKVWQKVEIRPVRIAVQGGRISQ
jgi:uncharacterized protein YciI